MIDVYVCLTNFFGLHFKYKQQSSTVATDSCLYTLLHNLAAENKQDFINFSCFQSFKVLSPKQIDVRKFDSNFISRFYRFFAPFINDSYDTRIYHTEQRNRNTRENCAQTMISKKNMLRLPCRVKNITSKSECNFKFVTPALI